MKRSWRRSTRWNKRDSRRSTQKRTSGNRKRRTTARTRKTRFGRWTLRFWNGRRRRGQISNKLKRSTRALETGSDETIAAAAQTLAQKKRKAESLAEEERRLEEEKAAQAEAEAEKRRQELEAQKRRNEEILEEQRRMREEQERQREEEAERQRLASEERAEAEREYFYQYATIEEQWFARNQELLAAQQDLQAAQKRGEDAVGAAAYRKVVDAQRNFDSIDREVQSSLEAMGDIDGAVEDAVGSIDKETGSSGTFSAYQAQEIAFGDYQRKLYDQPKTQTNLLRQLVSLNRDGGMAAFV